MVVSTWTTNEFIKGKLTTAKRYGKMYARVHNQRKKEGDIRSVTNVYDTSSRVLTSKWHIARRTFGPPKYDTDPRGAVIRYHDTNTSERPLEWAGKTSFAGSTSRLIVIVTKKSARTDLTDDAGINLHSITGGEKGPGNVTLIR